MNNVHLSSTIVWMGKKKVGVGVPCRPSSGEETSGGREREEILGFWVGGILGFWVRVGRVGEEGGRGEREREKKR